MEQNLTDISKLVYQNHLGLRKLAASALTDIPVLPAYRTTTRPAYQCPLLALVYSGMVSALMMLGCPPDFISFTLPQFQPQQRWKETRTVE